MKCSILHIICIIIVGLSMISCSSIGNNPIPHPPTFANIMQEKSLLYSDDYSDEDFAYSQRLGEALQYTQGEMQRLLQQDDVDYLIGMTYKMSYDDACHILQQEFVRIQHHKIALSLLITMLLLQEPVSFPDNMEDLFQALISLDRHNSFPYYLLASYYAIHDNATRCYEALAHGNTQAGFTDYFHELCRASIKTSEFLGYSPVVARYYALSQYDWLIYARLTKYLLAHESDNPDILGQGKILGERLQAFGATFMLELVGTSLQRKVLGRLDTQDPVIQEALHRIQVERQVIYDTLEQFYHVVEMYGIPEHRWVQYFEEMYTTSEGKAMRTLIHEYRNEKR